jgi:cob(I)alamin adenosyltransferase
MNKKRITIIHTGTGNSGKTQMGQIRISKTDMRVKYVGLLDFCQSHTFYTNDTTFLKHQQVIIKKLQDVFFLLGGLTHNPSKIEYEVKLKEYYDEFKNILESLLEELDIKSLDGFIRTNSINYTLMQLRCKIRETELTAVLLVEEHLIDEFHVKMLNLLSDVVFGLVWKVTEGSGTMSTWTGA